MITSVAYSVEKQPVLSALDQQEEALKELTGAISKALKLAINEVNLLSPSHARTAPGTYLYQETIRYIREVLKKYGFEPLNIGNVELTYNKNLGLALYYCRVTEDLKSLDSHPLSLRKRGEHTKRLMNLSENSVINPDMFPETLEMNNSNITKEGLMSIWAVMLYADFRTEQYIANLGYPESVDRYSRIDSFSHRIEISLDLPEMVTEKQPDYAENPNTDIQIKYEKLIA